MLVSILLIELSQYLSFTPVGWDWISGPQGRYLIPLLPMLGLAVPTGPSPTPLRSRLSIALTAAAAWIGLWAIPPCIQDFYDLAVR